MADERRMEEVQASPEEARFLRRFVRRTVLPWIACVGALAGLALGVALSPPPPAARVAAEPGAAHASAAQNELRAELASLRDELAALAARAARPAPAPRQAEGASAEASQGDLASIRDRVYKLELRQDRKEPERTALQEDLVTRLYDLERSVQSEVAARVGNLQTSEQRIERLEQRLSELEGLPAAPASAAPSSSPQ